MMINYDLEKIGAIIFDVDGVLSLSTIQMSPAGMPVRTVNIKDGYAMQLAIKMGLKLAIISGGTDKGIEERYRKLGMTDVFMSCSTKIEVFHRFMADNGLSKENVIYVGDDIPDYEIMQEVGCPCCPNDACVDIKAISTYISPCNGGMGCARDIIEQVLRAKGLWLSSAKAFGW
jgi:3-deoxy-D-manno-octulosonate 8-phosphate phosphatase (KDO 8-P phosphatase)